MILELTTFYIIFVFYYYFIHNKESDEDFSEDNSLAAAYNEPLNIQVEDNWCYCMHIEGCPCCGGIHCKTTPGGSSK